MAENRPVGPDHPLFDEMVAATSAVRIMRRVRGKKNPEDVPFGSPEWDAVSFEFMREVCHAIGGDPDELGLTDH